MRVATAAFVLAVAGFGLLSTGTAQAALPPAPAPVESILAKVRTAAGGDAVARVRTLHIVEDVSASGVRGQGEQWDDLTSGRFTQLLRLGPSSGGEGFDGHDAWLQDATGDAWVSQGYTDVTVAQSLAYLTSLSYLVDGRRAAHLREGGRRVLGGREYEVIEVNVLHGGAPIELWIDTRSYHVAREVIHLSNGIIRVELSGYRTVDGLSIPFAQRAFDLEGDLTLTHVRRVEVNREISAHLRMLHAVLTDFGVANGQAAASIPFELANNHIFIDVRVDGRGPFRFILDTGGANIIAPDLAHRVGLKAEGMVWVSKVELGAAWLRHQAFEVLPIGGIQRAEGMRVDGVVGFEVLRRFVTSIDYQHRRITFALPSSALQQQGVALPFIYDGRAALVAGVADGIAGVFLVDTGNRNALILYTPFVRAHSLRERYRAGVQGVVGYGFGGPTYGQLVRVGQFDLGALSMSHLPSVLSLDVRGPFDEPGVAGNVGGGLLRRFTCTFDYGHQVIYLAKNASFDQPYDYDRSGLFLVQEKDQVRVIGVLTGTPAAAAGMHAGDRILTVDGVPVTRMGLLRLRALFRGTPGTTVRLTVDSHGVRRTLTLTLKDYV